MLMPTPRSTTTLPRDGERASAIIAAIALMLIGAFVAVAIYTSSRTSADGSRSRLENQATQQLARDAGTVLAAMYSAGASGEFDGFIPSATRLQAHADSIGGRVISNAVLPNGLGIVDASRVPGPRRVTVRQSLQDGRTGYWQVLSARLPDWGRTPGGRVVVYVRTWTSGGGNNTTKPVVYRLEFRPTWFADYQLLFDGPMLIGSTAVLNGKVHSNGQRTSFFNVYDQQYDNEGLAIKFNAGARCVGTARVSTSAARIGGPGVGGCPAANRVSSHVPQVNILRAQDLAKRLRDLRTLPASDRTGISIGYSDTTSPIDVVLSGSTMRVSGVGTLDARVAGAAGVPGSRQGAVLVASGNVNLRGTLGSRARALIVAAAPPGSATYGRGSAPSVWVSSPGSVGAAAGDRTSSFGVVADGDIVFDELRACPVVARGAFVTVSGKMSIEPTWVVPIPTAGRVPCPGTATIEGSIVSHFPPLMNQPLNNAGYAGGRTYTYLASLYDNPPPMYPTAADWAIVEIAPANLKCFNGSGLVTTGACA